MPSVDSGREIKTEETINELPRQQKMAVVFLAFIAIGVIVIWALQLNSQINKPFRVPKSATPVKVASSTDPKLLDSDGDGLSDYDEINVYKTSPYLEDSDSDGISDKQEVEQGTDPNCPTGKNCNAIETSPTTASSSTEAVNPVTSTISDPSQVTPTMLRQVLLQSGQVTQAELDKISDADLVAGYYEALKTSQAANSSTSSNSVGTSTNQ